MAIQRLVGELNIFWHCEIPKESKETNLPQSFKDPIYELESLMQGLCCALNHITRIHGRMTQCFERLSCNSIVTNLISIPTFSKFQKMLRHRRDSGQGASLSVVLNEEIT